jgi:hypothetical protein
MTTDDIRAFSNRELQKRIENQRKVVAELDQIDDADLKRDGLLARDALDELRGAVAMIQEARGELERREQQRTRETLSASAAFRRQDYHRKSNAMTRWALSPESSLPKDGWRRGRGPREKVPLRNEAVGKVAWLLRNGMPHPLSVDELDPNNLSDEEAVELLRLTLMGFTGGKYTPEDLQRSDELLEKACDRPGAIQWSRDNLVRTQQGWERKEVRDG